VREDIHMQGFGAVGAVGRNGGKGGGETEQTRVRGLGAWVEGEGGKGIRDNINRGRDEVLRHMLGGIER
jgi:hypothetical protein